LDPVRSLPATLIRKVRIVEGSHWHNCLSPLHNAIQRTGQDKGQVRF